MFDPGYRPQEWPETETTRHNLRPMPLEIHAGTQLTDALTPNVGEVDGMVIEVAGRGDAWDEVIAVLRDAFHRSKKAAQDRIPVVYVVGSDDLLGRTGPGNAMVAAGILSAARTLAVEGRKQGIPANVIALEADTDPEVAARWILAALRGGPTGELIRLGAGHIGKALP